jgi:hypothetical protein
MRRTRRSKKIKNMLTQAELKRHLHYDPKTGIFTRLISNNGKTKVGEIAGTNCNGYIRIKVNKKSYQAHRLAFLYMEGYFPEYMVDHKFGIKDDNKWSELQHVTPTCNAQNAKIYRHNTSGFPGVTWRKQRKKWFSNITINNKLIYLGLYDDPLEAALARFTFEDQCPLWKCNYSGRLVKAIKRVWPEFNF